MFRGGGITYLGPKPPHAFCLFLVGKAEVLLHLLEAVLSRPKVQFPHDRVGEIIAFSPPPARLSGVSGRSKRSVPIELGRWHAVLNSQASIPA